MESVIVWIKQIIIFGIISNVVIQLLPGSKYIKYVKLFTGLIMIMITINPVLSFFKIDNIFGDFYNSYIMEQKQSDLKMQLKYAENSSYGQIITPYIEEITKNIENIVLECNLYPISTDIGIDTDSSSETFGQILKMDVVVSKKYKDENKIIIDKINVDINSQNNTDNMSVNEINILDKISSFYGIDKGNINISVKS